MPKTTLPTYTTVSEWIDAGGLEAGWFYLTDIHKESPKAVGFKAKQFNGAGNLIPVVCWIPRSVMVRITNDYYQDGPAFGYLIPGWMYQAKLNENYEL